MHLNSSRPFVDGGRGRIGLVATAPGNATEAEFNRYRPEGVAVMTTRTPLTSSTPKGIRAMNRGVEEAAAMLAENAYCDVILLSSTAGSFVEGLQADLAQARRLSQELHATVLTSAHCVVEAASALGVGSVLLVTPSAPELNQLEKRYLEESGLSVAAEAGFGYTLPRDILSIPPVEVERLVRRSDIPQADAVLISCSGLHVMDRIQTMEEQLGKPVLTSNQVGLWGCLRALGVPPAEKRLGALFCTC